MVEAPHEAASTHTHVVHKSHDVVPSRALRQPAMVGGVLPETSYNRVLYSDIVSIRRVQAKTLEKLVVTISLKDPG